MVVVGHFVAVVVVCCGDGARKKQTRASEPPFGRVVSQNEWSAASQTHSGATAYIYYDVCIACVKMVCAQPSRV
jgi:hypothetical protein